MMIRVFQQELTRPVAELFKTAPQDVNTRKALAAVLANLSFEVLNRTDETRGHCADFAEGCHSVAHDTLSRGAPSGLPEGLVTFLATMLGGAPNITKL